jgi:hypothetical protein
MKSLFIGLALLACATPAQAAEKWTCSHSAIIDPMSVVVSAPDKPEISRFELTSPDLIYDEHQRRYHIVLNDDDALVAAAAVSQIREGEKKRSVGAWTFAIDKLTGELALAVIWAAPEPFAGQAVHGTCLKD